MALKEMQAETVAVVAYTTFSHNRSLCPPSQMVDYAKVGPFSESLERAKGKRQYTRRHEYSGM